MQVYKIWLLILFLKIATSCKKEFVKNQNPHSVPFLRELCDTTLANTIKDLEAHQIQTFYEAAGQMVSAAPEENAKAAYISSLMNIPNNLWQRIMHEASINLPFLHQPDTLRELLRIIRINTAMCRSVGSSFAAQLGRIYLDMLRVYEAESNFIGNVIATGGSNSASTTIVKLARAVKSEILVLISTFIKLSHDVDMVANQFAAPLMEPLLKDYAPTPITSVSALIAIREAEVLNLFAEIVQKLQEKAAHIVPPVLGTIFEPTVMMITSNTADYPDHRLNFYRLLESINKYCFSAIINLNPIQLKLVMDAVSWAVKHTERSVGETGLTILGDLLRNVSSIGVEPAQPFYGTFYLQLIQDILQVLTDRLHKTHFKLHASILRHLFHLVEEGQILLPLWESQHAINSGASAAFFNKLTDTYASPGGPTNQMFVREYVRGLLSGAFPNLKPQQLYNFTEGMFDLSKDAKAYKAHLRDFLIEVLQFTEADGAGSLFAEEQQLAAQQAAAADAARRAQVPGLQNPYEALPVNYDTFDDI